MKQKKYYKIGILIDQLIIGGVQKIAVEDARSFKRLGHEAEVLVLMRKGYKPEYQEFAKGVKIRFLSDSYPWFFKHSFKFPIFSFFSTLHVLSPFLSHMAIKDKEFDVIISHGTTTCFTAQGIKRSKQIPYIAFIYDPMNYILKVAYSKSPLRLIFPILRPILKRLEKKLIDECEEVILLSKLHQNFISKTYKTKTIILPGATRIPKDIKRKPRNYVLATTRWDNKKNPRLLIKIAKAIPNAQIKIAGTWTNPHDYSGFTKEIVTQGLSKRIQLYPLVSEEELQKLYQQARLLVHPIKEAFGMGGLEAAANGCPVIIPDGSGITQHLTNGQDGLFVKKPTNKEFLSAVKKLWYNPRLANQMGVSARKKVLQFSWENHANKFLKIIDEKVSTNRYKTIVALETGHASETYLAGGDKLLEKMAYYFPDNIKITIILPVIGTKHWYDSRLNNIDLIILKPTIFDNNPRPMWVFLAYLVRIWQTYWQLRKLKEIDVLYSSTNVFPDVVSAFLFKLTHPNVPWIARVHHLITLPIKRPGRLTVNLVSYSMQLVSSFMMKVQSTKTLALNHKLLKTLIIQKFPRDKLEVLGAGIDFWKISHAKAYESKSLDGVFVGRIHPSKGIYDLVRIWKIVVAKKPDAKAIIVGEGAREEKAKLMSQIKKAQLSKNIKLSGFLPEKILNSTLKSSKIFLFTDHEAGWGLAIGEAMAAGCPVIGYNLDIFGDVFKQGYLTVPLGDEKEFANKVLYLLNNKKDYHGLRQQALSQARKLSWQQTANQFQNIVQRLTG